MKKFYILSTLLLPLLLLSAPKVVCDEETGVCVLVEDNGKEEQPASQPAVICDDQTGICVPAIQDQAAVADDTDHGTADLTLHSKSIGMTDAAEFLAFLKHGMADDGDLSSADSGGNHTFWGMLLLALIGGLALNLTPCVLPMLPINLAIIGASGGTTGFRRGLLYGIGMALTYGILGILAAFAGVSFGSINSSPLFNLAIAFIFVILSLGMAGVFTIAPGSKFHLNPGKLSVSKDLLALIMGALSAVLAGACVAPVVISVLIFAAQSGWYGSLVPFALGIGMALPWPFAGAGLSVLPKPGRFMAVLKYVFAAVIFAAGVYYAVIGIKLLTPTADNGDGFARLEAAAIESAENGKPVLVKFTASWCKNCHAMERTTLLDKEVKEYITDNYIMVTFPAEDPTEPRVKALLQKYDIPGFPAFVILK